MEEKQIYARAQVKSARIKETYCYRQEISCNPSLGGGKAPTGRLEVKLPFDGDQFFTRQASKDVEEQIDEAFAGNRAGAVIGHVGLSKYGQTDLNDVLTLSDHYGSFPLTVPIGGDVINNADRLRDDRHACLIAVDYSPHWPDVVPIQIDMDLLDEDVLSQPAVEIPRTNGRRQPDVWEQIAQQVDFRRNLLLIVQVKLSVSSRLVDNGSKPRVSRISIRWPTVTSFRNLHLFIGENEVNITYNPLTQSLEWPGVEMEAVEGLGASDELQTYVSQRFFFLIDQPGELYEQETLDGQIQVEIPGMLLSGLQARLYDGCGKLRTETRPELTTCLKTDYKLWLDDAFSQRTRSPYQHLHFDEVIPDPMRIGDIRTTLADRGFRIVADDQRPSDGPLKHFILAQRPEGLDTVMLWLFIEGKRYETERQTQMPGGRTYTSIVESGELKMYIRGEFPGDSRVLIQEINALQLALRDRFDRLRATR